jgi:hypothetical protein
MWPRGRRRAVEAFMAHRSSLILTIGAASLAVAGLVGCATQSTAPAVQAPQAQTAAAKVAEAGKKQEPIEVVSAQFGVFGADESGRRFLLETDHFPAVVAASYGWYIVFRTDRPTVVWREEFELPIPPPTWGPGEAMGFFTISPDRRTAVTERIIPTRLGFVANEWRYAPGDPLGAHKMRVYLDGQLIREFKFDIEEGPARQKRAPKVPEGESTT